jgi:hypothetical protein
LPAAVAATYPSPNRRRRPRLYHAAARDQNPNRLNADFSAAATDLHRRRLLLLLFAYAAVNYLSHVFAAAVAVIRPSHVFVAAEAIHPNHVSAAAAAAIHPNHAAASAAAIHPNHVSGGAFFAVNPPPPPLHV